MSNADLLPSLLFKINQNQLTLEAAIMELTLWVEQRGSAEVAGNVRGALDTISLCRFQERARKRRVRNAPHPLPNAALRNAQNPLSLG